MTNQKTSEAVTNLKIAVIEARIEKHDQMLESLMTSNTSLLTSIAELSASHATTNDLLKEGFDVMKKIVIAAFALVAGVVGLSGLMFPAGFL